jgi:hypothetical protein
MTSCISLFVSSDIFSICDHHRFEIFLLTRCEKELSEHIRLCILSALLQDYSRPNYDEDTISGAPKSITGGVAVKYGTSLEFLADAAFHQPTASDCPTIKYNHFPSTVPSS